MIFTLTLTLTPTPTPTPTSSMADEQINSEAVTLREKPKLRTKITFDKGGKWTNLKPPLSTNTGKEFACNPSDDPKCSLHLHGVTDSWGPFYSSKNAIGLVMATGNVREWRLGLTTACPTGMCAYMCMCGVCIPVPGPGPAPVL